MERRGRPTPVDAAVCRPVGSIPGRVADEPGPAGDHLGGLVLRLLHRGGRRRGGRGLVGGRLCPAVPGPGGLLRLDLDQHGSARRGAAAAPDRARRVAPARGRGHADRRARTVLHRRLAQRCPRTAPRRSAGRRGRAGRLHPGRAAGPHRGLGRPRSVRRRGGGSAALPPRLRAGLAGRCGVAELHRRHGDHRRRLLRAGRQLRGGEGSLRGVGQGGRARPAPRRGRAPRRHRAGRRVLLPDPTGRTGRSPGRHPGRVAGRRRPPKRIGGQPKAVTGSLRSRRTGSRGGAAVPRSRPDSGPACWRPAAARSAGR